jgi:dUTP pyrophosphatase
VHRLDPTLPLPRYETAGSAGFDLAASADVTIEPGRIALVPTGLVVGVPPGHFLGVFARSSTPLKRGLVVANGVGVVDSDYCGPEDEIKVQVLNVTAAPVEVRKGDRLAQGVVIPFVRVEWDEDAAPAGPSRGGFGSTG